MKDFIFQGCQSGTLHEKKEWLFVQQLKTDGDKKEVENQKNLYKVVVSVERSGLLWAQLEKAKEWKMELNWKNILHSVM